MHIENPTKLFKSICESVARDAKDRGAESGRFFINEMPKSMYSRLQDVISDTFPGDNKTLAIDLNEHLTINLQSNAESPFYPYALICLESRLYQRLKEAAKG